MNQFSDVRNIGLIYEDGMNMWAIADSQQKGQPHNNMPTNDSNNSYGGAQKTSDLPGNSSKQNPANVSQGGSFGEEEEIMVKGYGKMTKKQLLSLIDKTVDSISAMKANKKYQQMPSKLGMLNTLLKYVNQG